MGGRGRCTCSAPDGVRARRCGTGVRCAFSLRPGACAQPSSQSAGAAARGPEVPGGTLRSHSRGRLRPQWAHAREGRSQPVALPPRALSPWPAPAAGRAPGGAVLRGRDHRWLAWASGVLRASAPRPRCSPHLPPPAPGSLEKIELCSSCCLARRRGRRGRRRRGPAPGPPRQVPASSSSTHPTSWFPQAAGTARPRLGPLRSCSDLPIRKATSAILKHTSHAMRADDQAARGPGRRQPRRPRAGRAGAWARQGASS